MTNGPASIELPGFIRPGSGPLVVVTADSVLESYHDERPRCALPYLHEPERPVSVQESAEEVARMESAADGGSHPDEEGGRFEASQHRSDVPRVTGLAVGAMARTGTGSSPLREPSGDATAVSLPRPTDAHLDRVSSHRGRPVDGPAWSSG